MTTEPTMIERVAMALCVARGLDPDFDYDPNEVSSHGVREDARWKLFVAEARAAIEAMHEPTEAMKRVFASARPESPRTVWHEVIDAALAENPTNTSLSIERGE